MLRVGPKGADRAGLGVVGRSVTGPLGIMEGDSGRARMVLRVVRVERGMMAARGVSVIVPVLGTVVVKGMPADA